eukprot:TRINITY_DN83509_c0_g1_i1.p1 TRINITY_DN83509_c0_g1~~TRINITY_DN83509_c0_g1_i1.p1  ORF type:complete len:474 (+),score=46.89 TRINITY_DN83509_c0_g1_i1:59-1480(+)
MTCWSFWMGLVSWRLLCFPILLPFVFCVAAATPPYTFRGESIAVGGSPSSSCWDPSQNFTYERCCQDQNVPSETCFDGVLYTKDRCCMRDSLGRDLRLNSTQWTSKLNCLPKIRESLIGCLSELCDDEGSIHCSFFMETEFCKEHCGMVLPSSRSSSISRSNRLGRVLWCLGRHPRLQNAMDLFIGRGDGSTSMIVDGLKAKLRNHSLERDRLQKTTMARERQGETKKKKKRYNIEEYSPINGTGRYLHMPNKMNWSQVSEGFVVGFEEHKETFDAARQWLYFEQKILVAPYGTSGVWNAQDAADLQLALRETKLRSQSDGKVVAFLVQGRPIPAFVSEGNQHLVPSRVVTPLSLVCNILKIQAVLLDPPFSADLEWRTIARFCTDLTWVVIQNVNQPGMAGWIRDRLLVQPEWAELFSGETVDNSLDVNDPLFEDFYSHIRSWTVLVKVSKIEPGKCDSWRFQGPSPSDKIF